MGEPASWRIGPTAFVTLALLASAAQVHAQRDADSAAMPERARLLLPACNPGPFDRAVFMNVLQLELAAQGVAIPRADTPVQWSPRDARVSIDIDSCSPETSRVRVEVLHLGTKQKAERAVVFTQTQPDRRGRVLALAVAEFLSNQWRELGGMDARSEREKLIAEAEERMRVVHRQELQAVLEQAQVGTLGVPKSKVVLGLGAHAQIFLEFPDAVVGPSVFLAIAPTDFLRLRFDFDAGLGRTRTDLGELQLRNVTLGVSALFGGGKHLWAGVGPHVDIGWGSVGGANNNQMGAVGDLKGVVASGALQTVLQLHLGKGWWADVDARIGYGFSSYLGLVNGAVAGGIGGALLHAGLGVGYALK